MTNNLYHKFNYRLKDIDPEMVKGRVHTSYGHYPHPRISYYYIKDNDYFYSRFFSPICKIRPDYTFYCEIANKGLLSPHRDHNVSCCVNFYFDPNGSKTMFHKTKSGSMARTYPGKLTSNIYEIAELDTVDSFTAEKNDCYLLNVAEIHSVLSPNDGTRKFITWQWTSTPYEEVLDNLIEH